MSLKRLDIYNVRNIREQSILPATTFNFIYGKNGSGKSALIEAIFLLGRAKSFRSSSIKSVIAFNQTDLIVSGDILKDKQRTIHMGIRMDGTETEIRINHLSNQKRISLAYGFPLQIIHPKSFELLDASSKIRREFLDWGIFNHDERFLDSWRKYKQALLQRNALLKLKSINQLNVWNNELVNYGTIVNESRAQYITALKHVLSKSINYFLNLHDFDITLMSGWSTNKDLRQELNDNLERDLRYGFTHSGPHRGDFHFLVKKRFAKDVVSRGQLKLLILCLKLAQVELILQERKDFGCILIDDIAAELDRENRLKVLQYLSQIQCQAFITTTELNDFGDLSFIDNYKLFHVEHGEIESKYVPHGTSK